MSLLDPVYEQAICAQNPWLWDTEDPHRSQGRGQAVPDRLPGLPTVPGRHDRSGDEPAGVVKDRMLLRKRARA